MKYLAEESIGVREETVLQRQAMDESLQSADSTEEILAI